MAAYAALTQRARGCEAELRILGAWGDGCHLVCFAGGHRRSVPPDAHLNLEGGDQRVFRVNDNASRFPTNFKADRKLHLGALPSSQDSRINSACEAAKPQSQPF